MTTPTPGDMSARQVIADMQSVADLRTIRHSYIGEKLKGWIAALSALPAAGGLVGEIREYGPVLYTFRPAPPPGTKLYTTPQPSAAEEPDGYTAYGEFRHACDADERMRAEWTPLYFAAPKKAADKVEWGGATRTMQEHLYLMTGERDRYKALHEQAAPTIARMERRITEMDAAVGAQGDGDELNLRVRAISAIEAVTKEYPDTGADISRYVNFLANERMRLWEQQRNATPTPAAGKGVDDASGRELSFYLRWALGVIEDHGLDEFALTVQHMHVEATAALTRQPVAGDGMAEYVLALLVTGGYVTQAKVDEARRIALGCEPAQPADDDEAMVPGDADDMAEALAEISKTLGCDNTLDDILHAIDALATPAAGKGVDDAMVERALEAIWRPPFSQETKQLMRASLEAALTRQPVAGDGMVLVPREPTEAMLAAAPPSKNFCCPDAWETYAAMIAAAPAATPTDGGEG